MRYETYPHRFADIILNSDYELKQEIERAIAAIDFKEAEGRFVQRNKEKKTGGKKESKGKQSTLNEMFKEQFTIMGWESEKNVFNDPSNDLTIDFWKRKIGVDVAFNHRSFIGGDLLRLQAAAEVKNIIKVGVYICPTKAFAKSVNATDAASMVSFERAKWYLENFIQCSRFRYCSLG
ncbi:MAG: BglII/BstYI family type II restriction endonuclease [Dehalococcoidia bacterium]|nr:BglII/BstYI family type II restriction endonuclease [Dehalococcoidia bacterium]